MGPISESLQHVQEAMNTAHTFFQVPLCKDDLDKTINVISGCIFGDIHQGLSLEGLKEWDAYWQCYGERSRCNSVGERHL